MSYGPPQGNQGYYGGPPQGGPGYGPPPGQFNQGNYPPQGYPPQGGYGGLPQQGGYGGLPQQGGTADPHSKEATLHRVVMVALKEATHPNKVTVDHSKASGDHRRATTPRSRLWWTTTATHGHAVTWL